MPLVSKRYVLSSAVITTPGTYSYVHIPPTSARRWLEGGEYESALGYDVTAAALHEVTGVHVEVSRHLVRMKPGDEALVFRVKINPRENHHYTTRELAERSEIGLLRRLA